MKKTLYIQIDNNSLPEGCGEDVEVLDCRCINDFCSIVGDALVSDLKDENGKPYYRLINPVGRLLSDFEKVDKANYDHIIAQWLDVLGEMLHKGVAQCDEQFTIHFPQQYVDWLLCNENDYYVKIGKCLQSNEGKVYLDADGVSEDIISALHMKIRRFLNDNKDDIEYIVFSNERIGNSSYVVKQLKKLFDSYSFIRLGQWEQILQGEQQRRIENLEDYRAFWVDDFKLGVTTRDNMPEYLKVRSEYMKDGRLSHISHPNKKHIDALLSILYGETKDSGALSYNDISPFLISQKGFFVKEEPHNEWESYCNKYVFRVILTKETETYVCSLVFVFSCQYYCSISSCKEKLGTLGNIDIKLK